MTKEYSNINPDEALYNLARKYPGGVEALALRLGRSANVLYKQLSPGVDTHHLSPDDFLRIIEMCAEVGMEDAPVPLHALCFRLGHVAVRLPSLNADLDTLYKDVLVMLSEEGAVSQGIQDAFSERGDGGNRLTAAELANIESHIERSMATLAAIRGELREKHKRDYPAPGGVRG